MKQDATADWLRLDNGEVSGKGEGTYVFTSTSCIDRVDGWLGDGP
jgi:hypothetical protein